MTSCLLSVVNSMFYTYWIVWFIKCERQIDMATLPAWKIGPLALTSTAVLPFCVGMASKICNKLHLHTKFRNLHAKFGVSSFFNSWDLVSHTDGLISIDSASDSEKEYIYFMGFVTPPYACYVHFHIVSMWVTNFTNLSLYFVKQSTGWIYFSKCHPKLRAKLSKVHYNRTT